MHQKQQHQKQQLQSTAARDNTPGTSAEPQNPLTLVNPPPPPGVPDAPPNRFILFTTDWLDLQCYVQQALALPITTNDFSAVYGAFPGADQALIINAIAALKRVHDLSSTFGDPQILKQKIVTDPSYLNSADPPAVIYGHIVWLAGQVYNAASTFAYTLPQLLTLLGQGTEDERANNVKAVLVGPGGLVSTADDMGKKTGILVQKLAAFDIDITDANTQVQTYISKESDLMARTDQLIGATRNEIDNVLQPAADEAYKKWRDYTISAATTSVGVLAISGGLLWPVAVGLAAGLGKAAADEKASYNSLLDQIASEEEDIRKKNHLKVDLTGFNTRISQVGPALGALKTSLQTVEGVFNQVSMNLAYVANNYGVKELSSLPWVTQALKIGDATNKWHDIGATTQEFTQSSLVSYDFTTPFGAKIPDKPVRLRGAPERPMVGAPPVARLRRRF